MTLAIDSDPIRTAPAEGNRPSEFDRLAVVTIQGGGTFGLNLLGQLSYLTEELKIIPVAVAGNSAGSIVAVLFWAGYTPWEIRNIFAEMAEKKVLEQLLGEFGPPHYTPSSFRSLKNDCEQFADRNLSDDEPRGWFARGWRRVCSPVRTLRELW